MENKKEMTKMISSFVVGDGALSNLYSSSNKNSKYYLKQISIHQDYVEWQANYLENLTKVTIARNSAYTDSRGYNCKEQLSLSTRCHPFYTTMRNNFYLNNSKIIFPHYLKLWDEQSLAILYMDNGWLEKTVQKSGNIYYRVGIATHAYSYGDNILLKQMIKEKFSIEFDVKRHLQRSGEYKFYLRNSKNNSLRFIDLIEKFIQPSFQYKINKTFSAQPTPEMDDDIVCSA